MKAKCKGVFNPCKQAIKVAEAGRRARFEEHPYAFLFEGGRLVMIEVHGRDFAAVVSEAPSKYGKPTKLEEETDRTATEPSSSWEALDGIYPMARLSLSKRPSVQPASAYSRNDLDRVFGREATRA